MNLIEMPEFKGSDLIATDIQAMAEMSRAIKRLYGVGRIYISTDPESPAQFIGGQWNRIGGGRVLVSAGFSSFRWNGDSRIDEVSDAEKAGQEGGEMRHTHLTPVGYDDNNVYFLMDDVNGETRVPAYGSALKYHQKGIAVWQNLNRFPDSTVRVAYTRENSNYPPYYTVFMWERVA